MSVNAMTTGLDTALRGGGAAIGAIGAAGAAGAPDSTDANAGAALIVPIARVEVAAIAPAATAQAALTLDAMLRASGLPWIEARMLAGHALDLSAVQLAVRLRDTVAPPQARAFAALAVRRCAGEPIAYILGQRDFYGRTFVVTPDVLIPRPETELLCEALLERLFGASSPTAASVLDLGTGSGAIAVTLACERPLWHITAVDQSPAALAVARTNALRLCPHARLRFVVSDWFSSLDGERYDAIISNPPYVAAGDAHLAQGDLRFEPQGALCAGPQGMDALQAIATQALAHLYPGGWLLLEHGFAQGGLVRDALHANGLLHIRTLIDLAGCERVTLGRRSGQGPGL